MKQQESEFPKAAPEETGVPSQAIVKLLKRFEEQGFNLHSLLVLRHGKLISENYWKPFTRQDKHRMYSVSKSFVSLGIGKMIDEGKITLEDRVVSFFPQYDTPSLHPHHRATRIGDLLRMADCHDKVTYEENFLQKNWIKTWFDTAPTHYPGMVFRYSTVCTQLLCAIIEQREKKPFLEVIRKSILDPIGFSADAWCIQAPDGFSFGGSGVMCTPLDLCKVALLFMNKGAYQGKQLVSASYIEAATNRQIDNLLTNECMEHQQGYGYQVWRTRFNGFAFVGMGGQLAICLPDYDLAVITTADVMGQQPETAEILRGVFEELLPGLSNLPIAPDSKALLNLLQVSDALQVKPLSCCGACERAMEAKKVAYRMDENTMGISWAEFTFEGEEGTFRYQKQQKCYEIKFGFGHHVAGEFPEKYFGKQIGVESERGYRTLTSGCWADPKTLLIQVRITDDYFGTLNINATFDGELMTLMMTKIAEAFLTDYEGCASGIKIQE